jgi:hypothetical protein
MGYGCVDRGSFLSILCFSPWLLVIHHSLCWIDFEGSFCGNEVNEVIFNLFIPAVFTEQYIESMGQSQQTQLYCG